MSNWTTNFRPGVLKRSDEYDAFIRKEYGQKQEWIRRNNWKYEQIEKLKKERAEAARLLAETQGLQTLAAAPDSSLPNQRESGLAQPILKPQ